MWPLQGISSELSGLAFDGAGNLLASSTNGVVYQLDCTVTDHGVVPVPTITDIVSVAADGLPAVGGEGSANVGQAIEIVGTNLNVPGLRVLVPTRNVIGVESLVAVTPTAVNDAGHASASHCAESGPNRRDHGHDRGQSELRL